MEPWYRPYCQAVVRCLRHATAKERRAVGWELECHLQDHAEALEAAGYPPEQAQAHALEAMGDPQEVGSALDREFPLGWLILSRGALALVILGATLLVLLLPQQLYGCVNSLIARGDPLHSNAHFRDTDHTVETTAPLDVTFTLPNGDVIDLYGVILVRKETGKYLVPQEADGYIAAVYAVCYNKNPFRDPYYQLDILDGLHDDGSPYQTTSGGGKSSPNADYGCLEFSTLAPGDTLTVRCRAPGYTAQQTVPLPWQEVNS